jgi:hypothetical protein
MKKRIGLTLAVGLVASLASMQALTVPCPANTQLDNLILITSGVGNGCTVFDKIFTNVAYIPGGGAPPAASVLAHLDADPFTLTFGWHFLGLWTDNFELKYTVSELPAVCPSCQFFVVEEQQFPATQPVGPQAISVIETAVPSIPGSPVMLNNATLGGNTNDAFVPSGVVSISKDATTSGLSTAFPLLSFQSDVREIVPEPVTLSLMGISLLGLSFIGWRRAQK